MPYKESSWDLSQIKPKSIEVTLKEIEQKVNAFEKNKKDLTNTISSNTFLKIIKQLEEIREKSDCLAVYTHLRFCEDSTNQKAVAAMSKVELSLTNLNNRLIFFSLWFKKLNEKKAQELIHKSKEYHYYFERLRKTAPYTLSEQEEKIINLKDGTGVSALNTIYNLTTSNFVYLFQGKKRTQEEMVTYVRSSSSKIRKEAYQAILKPYKENKDVLGEIYKNIVNDWYQENILLRKHTSPIGVRNTLNDLPNKAVSALLRVCQKNEPLFHEFFDLKRKALGLAKLTRYDIYAPLKEEKEVILYDEAIKIILETFEDFSSEFKESVLKIIEQKHIHSLVQKGKRSGAFCCGASTKLVPYVLLSYTKKFRDVSTLAHELGHGVHHVLSSVQTEFTNDACLPLAETASIFSEMLLSEKMIKKDPKIAKTMLFTKLDDLYASIIRQAGFVRFEIKAHQLFQEGKTIDEVSKIYLEDLRKQLGPKIEIDPLYAYEWTYIPHIYHSPFYCYSYAFGNLLTLALYEMYKEKGKPFAAKIVEMLQKGGSCSPLEITKAVGVDICDEDFWQKGFDLIKEMIKEIKN